jgi:competence ComEA-like helix-hairpin-helix protein
MPKQTTAHDSNPLPHMLLAAAVSVLAVSIVVASEVRTDQTQTTKPAPATATPQTPQTNDPKGAGNQTDEEFARVGEVLVNKVCSSSCHGLDKLDEMRRTRSGWSDEVGDMVGRGAMANDAELATIKKYLARYYGLVAVNTATAEELSAVVGFSAKDAEAIVAYRTAHGKFADADALSRVPGIDKTKIEEQPDALLFK